MRGYGVRGYGVRGYGVCLRYPGHTQVWCGVWTALSHLRLTTGSPSPLRLTAGDSAVPLTAFAQMGVMNYEAPPLTAAGYGWGLGNSFAALDGLDSQYTFPLQSPKDSILPSVRSPFGCAVDGAVSAMSLCTASALCVMAPGI